MEKPDPTAVLKLALSSLDDDLFDKTDEEVKQELAEAGVDHEVCGHTNGCGDRLMARISRQSTTTTSATNDCVAEVRK